MQHISTYLDRFFEKAFERRLPPADVSIVPYYSPDYAERFLGIPTGFSDIDGMTGGFQRSDLIAVAAESDVGMTALCLSIAYHDAFLYGKRVGIFSSNPSGESIVLRLLSMGTAIDIQRLAMGLIDDDEWPAISRFLGRFRDTPIFLNDDELDIDELIGRIREMKTQGSIDIVIVDSVERIRGKRHDRTSVTRELKHLARQLDIPIVVNCSVRPLKRWMKIPILTDLRDDMAIEEDADIVMFIYREELQDPETEKKGIAEIHLAKHRNGPEGVVNLRFFNGIARFVDLEIYREPA